MKILWVSNGMHTNTGYGTSTRAVVPRIIADGHDVIVLSFWGVQGEALEVDGVLHLPAGHDSWGNDAIVPYFNQYERDVVIVHRDNWVNDNAVSRAVPTACWFPVDHEPVSDSIRSAIESAQWNATLSAFSVDACRNAGYEVDYIPHGVEPDIMCWRPDKAEARATLFPRIPADAYLVLMVGANKGYPSRKGFVEAFMALKKAMDADPNIYAYIHADISNAGGGPDLQRVVKTLGMDAKRVHLLSPRSRLAGISENDMAAIYRSADVLLHPSYAEGFGMCIIEAQACGIPVITNNSTSQLELTYFGKCVDGKADFLSAHYGWWKIPDPDALAAAIIDLKGSQVYPSPEAKSSFIHKSFSQDYIYKEYMRPWLQKIETDLKLMG